MKLAATGGDIDAWLPQVERNDTEIRDRKAELKALETRRPERTPDIEELLSALSDVSQEVFTDADPQLLWNFYKAIGLEVSYAHRERLADVVLHLRPNTQAMPEVGGGNSCVRRGT